MAADLRQLDGWIVEGAWPEVPCPVCKQANMTVERIQPMESAESTNLHDHPNWEPDCIEGGFFGWMNCQSALCQEHVIIGGDYQVPWTDGAPEVGPAPANQYRLRYVRPAFVLLEAPSGTPDDVVQAVASAARVLFIDPSAAANRLRARPWNYS